MKIGNIVKFRTPMNDEEEAALMIVIEVRDDRILVSDLRFSEWTILPTDLYPLTDLEVVISKSYS